MLEGGEVGDPVVVVAEQVAEHLDEVLVEVGPGPAGPAGRVGEADARPVDHVAAAALVVDLDPVAAVEELGVGHHLGAVGHPVGRDADAPAAASRSSPARARPVHAAISVVEPAASGAAPGRCVRSAGLARRGRRDR